MLDELIDLPQRTYISVRLHLDFYTFFDWSLYDGENQTLDCCLYLIHRIEIALSILSVNDFHKSGKVSSIKMCGS